MADTSTQSYSALPGDESMSESGSDGADEVDDRGTLKRKRPMNVTYVLPSVSMPFIYVGPSED
jgi:hypothetical protein